MTKFLKNADVTGYISQTLVTSSLLKTDSSGKLVAATAGTDYQAPTAALLPTGGAAGQILAKIDATNYNTQWIDNFAQQLKHDVKLGATLAKGKAVYVSSANGTNMIVSAASNASEATSSKTLGLLETGGVTNDIVKVITEGLLAGLDTSTATAGDPVWLGTGGDLIFGLANKPVAPAHLVFIGIVTRVQSVNGEIFVKVQNGFELDELHNVGITSAATNDGLFYEITGSVGLWKNKSIATVLGYTPANGANYLPLTGGTLTGALVINPANSSTVGLDLASNTFRLRTDSSQPFPRQLTTTIGSGTLVKMQAAGYGATYVTDLGFYTSSGSAVNTTPNLYLTGGNNRVGINTDTPAYTLDVSGTIGASGAITANSFVKASGTSAQFLMADGSVSLGATATARTEQIFTATSGQTTFTVTGGYVVGLVDVYINGVKLLPADFTATNGSTVVLGTGAVLNDSVTIINYTATIAALPTSRDVIDYTATSVQTTFTVTGGYVVGLLDIYVNGVKLTSSEYTATNGTTFVLTVASVAGDQVQAIRYNASVNGVSGAGTTNYHAKFTASGTVGNSIVQDDGTTVTIGSTDSNLLMPRAATSNNALISFATGGTTRWNVGLRSTYSAEDFYIWNPVLGIPYITLSSASSLANFGVAVRASSYNSYIGSGIFMQNASAGTNSVYMRVNNTGGDLRTGIESSVGGTFQTGTSAYAAVFGNHANYATQFTTNGTVRLTISAGGDAAFTGSITTGGDVTINNGAADGGQLVLMSSGYSNWNIDNYSGSLRAYYNASVALSINSSLAATFSSSVTAAHGASGNNGGYIINYSTASTASRSWRIINDQVAFGDFAIQQSTTQTGTSYNQPFYINPSGNVGIGTTSPNSALNIVGNSSTNGLTVKSAGNGGTYPFRVTWSGGTDGDMLCVNDNGNVGIGTTNPQAKLYTLLSDTGTSPSLTNTIVVGNNNATLNNFSGIYFSQTSGDGGAVIGGIHTGRTAGSRNSDLAFYTMNASTVAERMRITSVGNVGINNSNPNYYLDVQGGTIGTFISVFQANSTFAFGSTNGKRLMAITNNTGDRNGLQLGYDATAGTGIIAAATESTGAGLDFYTYNGSSWGTRFRITKDGQVFPYNLGSGAGTNAARYSTSTGQLTYDTSSARYKDNIRDSVYGLADILKMRSAMFEYKEDARTDIGLVAEELYPIIPELVGIDKSGKPDSVSYDRLVSVLIKAIQELKAELDLLKNK